MKNVFSALCKDFGISRKTGYKWVNRYKEWDDIEGLKGSDLIRTVQLAC